MHNIKDAENTQINQKRSWKFWNYLINAVSGGKLALFQMKAPLEAKPVKPVLPTPLAHFPFHSAILSSKELLQTPDIILIDSLNHVRN